jgi:hypothetical protein
MRGPLATFIVRTLAWLPPAFAVWYFAGPILMWPVAAIVEFVARVGFSDLVRGVEQSGATLVFATTLKPGAPGASTGQITVDVDMLLYAFGMPLYAALAQAAREPGWPRRMLAGYALLVPFAAWGALADFLKIVAIGSGPVIASQTGFVAWQREAIAVGYQFGSLVFPTVVPAVAWVLAHRDFVLGLRRASH